MLSAPRPLLPAEYEAALDLWPEVFFGVSREYFARYFDGGDDQYRPGDTFGIWDGTALVSAVHLCRRSLCWDGGIVLCGSIANVATREEYRRQGLSRFLLREIIAKMEQERFDFSLLGTGTHGHYAALGWKQINRPQYLITLPTLPQVQAGAGEWQSAALTSMLPPLYAHAPRPLQFVRSPRYFDDWTGWVWRSHAAEMYVTDAGYVVADFPGATEDAVTLLEWRAENEASERFLLNAACVEAVRRGFSTLFLTAAPQFLDAPSLAEFGQVEPSTDESGMIRRVSLSAEDFAQVGEAYRSGQATWWEGDGF
jgi:GNAT superfamily N-acetyltransferase